MIKKVKILPRVSIIIPVYNAEKYINSTINSIISQDYENIEIIIVNDGSTDESVKLIKQYSDKRITLINQKNRGVLKLNETINTGLDKATGKYVTMFPADDIMLPNSIRYRVKALENNPNATLCYGFCRLIDSEGNEQRSLLSLKLTLLNIFSSANKRIEKYTFDNYIMQPTVLLRKSSLLELGGYIQPDGNYAEDYPTQFELMLKGDTVFIWKYLAAYRRHSLQATASHWREMLASDLHLRKQMIAKLQGKLMISEKKSIYLRKKIIRNYHRNCLYFELKNLYKPLSLRNIIQSVGKLGMLTTLKLLLIK